MMGILAGSAVICFHDAEEPLKHDALGEERAAPISSRKRPAPPVNLSRDEIVAKLPFRPLAGGMPFLTDEVREQMDVFRQLGVVDGEKSLEFLMVRYGDDSTGMMAGLPQAMAFAFSGWMENDLEGALAAFQTFVRVPDGLSVSPTNHMFQWKGQSFYTGLF